MLIRYIKSNYLFLLTIVLSVCLFSCSVDDSQGKKDTSCSEPYAAIMQNDRTRVFDSDVFSQYALIESIEKKGAYSYYEDGPVFEQSYKHFLYAESAEYTDLYSDVLIMRKVFENINSYQQFGIELVYKQFIFFHVIDENTNYILRYNIETDIQEIIFEYHGDNQITLAAVNDDYIIWREDENSNWLKVSLYCYHIEKGISRKFFTYSRDEKTGMMYAWNFNEIILRDSCVYFDNTESITDGVANINLYEYDITTDIVKIIADTRAAHPQKYNGLSWMSYDSATNEYILKSKDNHASDIPLNVEYTMLISSDRIIVGLRNAQNNSIMYFDGESTYPIIESTNNIDRVFCTDYFITWDGWSIDAPMFYDIDKQKIIRVDCLEEGRRYAGYVTDTHLIFEAHDYVPNPTIGGGAITTQSLIYYFIPVSDLRN